MVLPEWLPFVTPLISFAVVISWNLWAKTWESRPNRGSARRPQPFNADAWRRERRERRQEELRAWDAQFRALDPPKRCLDGSHEHQLLRNAYGDVIVWNCLTVDTSSTYGCTVAEFQVAMEGLGRYLRS